MKKSIVSIILCLMLSVLITGSQIDKPWLNRKSNVPPPNDAGNNRLKPVPTPETYMGTRVREKPIMPLNDFGISEFNHPQSLWFCQRIAGQIDNIEKKGDKIIRISIKGFADGTRNTGIDIKKLTYKDLYDECKKVADVSKPIMDRQLAELRACQVTQQLNELLRSKSYYVSVTMPREEPFDYADSKEYSKGEYRKVEVKIDYFDREK